MKVLVAAVSHCSEISGVQRHGLNLVRGLLTRSEVTAVDVVIGPWQWTMNRALRAYADERVRVHVGNVERSTIARNLWHFRKLPELANAFESDILHLSYPVPVDRRKLNCALVTTLHDMYPYEIPANFGWIKGMLNRLVLRSCLESVDAVASVSQATAAQLWHWVPERVSTKCTVVPNCVELTAMESTEPFSFAVMRVPFLLCVAQHRRNKNIPFLLQAFKSLLEQKDSAVEMRLLIVGIGGPESERILREVRKLGLGQRVQLAQGLSEPELAWCYRHCEAVVAPSLTEGFGLPVVEGLLHGARIVCSDIQAFRELGAERCRLVWTGGRHGVEEFADAIARSLQEPRPRETPFPQFSAAVVGEKYVRLYQQVLERRFACARVHTGLAAHPGRQGL